MTYSDAELGVIGSAPVEMYHFHRGGWCWPYTSADSPQLLNGITYNPVTISRGSIEKNQESGSNELEVRLHVDLKMAEQFLVANPPTPVGLRVYRRHRTDPEAIVIFRGTVGYAERFGYELVLRCETPLGARERSVPTEIIARTCPHVLYGPRCGLTKDDWKHTGTIATISGTEYKASGMTTVPWENDWANAGFLYNITRGGYAFVQDHWTGVSVGVHHFDVLQPVAGWAVSDSVAVYAGCDRLVETCRDKFDNVPNFGGFPLHPERNPFLDLKGN
jgi:uncharacterized phage protein (TIGR02218 family)